MASPTGSARFRRSIRELPGRTPLRVKLIAAVLALVTAALAVISIAGIAFLRGYLLHQADQELRTAAYANTSTIIYPYLFLGAGPAQPDYGGLSVQWLPTSGKLQQVVAEYTGFRGGQLVPGPAVQRTDGWLYKPGPANDRAYSWLNTRGAPVSAPVTVSASSGNGRWRVVSSAATFHGPAGQTAKGTIILGIDVTTAVPDSQRADHHRPDRQRRPARRAGDLRHRRDPLQPAAPFRHRADRGGHRGR